MSAQDMVVFNSQLKMGVVAIDAGAGHRPGPGHPSPAEAD